MMHTIGLISANSSAPSHGTLVDKLIDLGATEIWQMDDNDLYVRATLDSSHDLYQTGGSATNIEYEQTFECFPDIKGIKFNASSDTAFFQQLAITADLQLKSSMTAMAVVKLEQFYTGGGINVSAVGIGELWSSASDNSNFQLETDNGIVKDEPKGRMDHLYGAWARQNTSVTAIAHSGLSDQTGEYIFLAKRTDNGLADWTIDYYLNGFKFGTKTFSADNKPVGGENGKLVIGRNATALFSDTRFYGVIGPISIYDKALTDAEVVEIQNSALQFKERTGFSPSLYSLESPVVAGTCLPLVNDMDQFYGPTFSEDLSKYAVIQMGSGKITISNVNAGDSTTTKQGDIIVIEKSGSTITGTLYPS